jgi:glycine cleavage system H lipoate-binding protein
VEINTALRDKPELVNQDPHAAWMVAIRLNSADETSTLLDASQYQDLVK